MSIPYTPILEGLKYEICMGAGLPAPATGGFKYEISMGLKYKAWSKVF